MTHSYAIITPTYRNDFNFAVDLCESVDRHISDTIPHYLVIPRGDRKLFASLENHRREIICKEDVLGNSGFRRLPAPTSFSIPGMKTYRINEQWIDSKFRRTSGWIIQQLVKLSAPFYTNAENLIFVDSDVTFIKSFDPNQVLVHGKLPLHKHTNGVNKSTHINWINSALDTLAVSRSKFELASYIGSILFWRRENVLSLHARIQDINKAPWQLHLSTGNNFSEYMLYGLYCTNVLGDVSQHEVTELKICHTLWELENGSINDFLAQIRSEHVAIHVQSFLSKDKAQRRDFAAKVEKLILERS